MLPCSNAATARRAVVSAFALLALAALVAVITTQDRGTPVEQLRVATPSGSQLAFGDGLFRSSVPKVLFASCPFAESLALTDTPLASISWAGSVLLAASRAPRLLTPAPGPMTGGARGKRARRRASARRPRSEGDCRARTQGSADGSARRNEERGSRAQVWGSSLQRRRPGRVRAPARDRTRVCSAPSLRRRVLIVPGRSKEGAVRGSKKPDFVAPLGGLGEEGLVRARPAPATGDSSPSPRT
jgi:hypothetical protein